MGQFRIVIDAYGGHGCQREVKDGQVLQGCGRQGCPDCEAGSLIADFARRTGSQIVSASLTHWPGTTGEVVDEYHVAQAAMMPRLSRMRRGTFG